MALGTGISPLGGLVTSGGGTCADATITDNLASPTTVEVASGGSYTCTGISSATCAQLNNTSSGLTVSQRQLIQAVDTIKTGQTTSITTGDDGNLQLGRLSGWLVLNCNNGFGNTNRFTDTAGGQTYSNGIIVDWENRRFWYDPATTDTWSNHISTANALSVGGFSSGWHMPNLREQFSVMAFSGSDVGSAPLNYAPFNISGTGQRYWTSTQAAGGNRVTLLNNTNSTTMMSGTGAASSIYCLYCRVFTFADLGL